MNETKRNHKKEIQKRNDNIQQEIRKTLIEAKLNETKRKYIKETLQKRKDKNGK